MRRMPAAAGDRRGARGRAAAASALARLASLKAPAALTKLAKLTTLTALATLLGGCASAPLALDRPVVLLGEVHDNTAQHALRLAALGALLERGARPALAMEQIDRERQPQLDALLARQPPPDAATVAAAVVDKSWNRAFYEPYIALALRYRLPIVAANVGRDEARRVMREGLAAAGFDAAVPAPLLAAQAHDIEQGHCGALDAATAQRMALAQVARDQFMARVLERHAARGVVLLAGNGHVRSDIGAPHWLDAATRARSEAIGLVEQGEDDDGHYDRRLVTPRQPRADPCAALRRPGAPAPRPAA